MLAALLGPAASCRAAGLILQVPDLVVAPGSSGSFDILLINSNAAGGDSYNVSADTVVVSLSGPLGVAFTDVTIDTIAPYIYVTSGTTQGGGPLSLDAFPNVQFTASDAEFAAPGYRTLNPGDVFGLAHVSYSVDSSTPSGRETILIAADPITSLSDVSGEALLFTIINGSITMVIPEPSALMQAATATMIVLICWRRREKRPL